MTSQQHKQFLGFITVCYWCRKMEFTIGKMFFSFFMLFCLWVWVMLFWSVGPFVTNSSVVSKIDYRVQILIRGSRDTP